MVNISLQNATKQEKSKGLKINNRKSVRKRLYKENYEKSIYFYVVQVHTQTKTGVSCK